MAKVGDFSWKVRKAHVRDSGWRSIKRLNVHMCVCVWEREMETDRQTDREERGKWKKKYFQSSIVLVEKKISEEVFG